MSIKTLPSPAPSKHPDLLFVYGSLLSDMGNHYLLENDESDLVDTFETESIYSLRDLGYYPGVHKNGSTSIKGELWSVSEAVWRRVEQLEGYPSFYDRTPLETPHGLAQMYFLAEEDVSERVLVESGDWKAYYNASGRNY